MGNQLSRSNLKSVEPLKIQLPNAPVDGYEINFWSIDYETVAPCRLQYHANTPYATLYPDEGHGAAFVDCWRIFRRDSCEGRGMGWNWPAITKWNLEYAGKESAVAALQARLEQQAESFDKMAAAIREKIKGLTDAQ